MSRKRPAVCWIQYGDESERANRARLLSQLIFVQ
jgi:hypothetical protein